MLSSRIALVVLIGVMLVATIDIASSTRGADGTPVAIPTECEGADEYVAAFQAAVLESLGESEDILDDGFETATSAELATAADGFAAAKGAVALLDPPPAGAAFHAASIAVLGIFSQFLDSFATGGSLAALAYSDSIDELTAESELAAAEFEQACGVDVTDDEESPPYGAGAKPAGTRADPVRIGDEVQLNDGWTVTVLAVTSDATDAVLRENQFNEPPATGRQFFIVRVAATYTGEGSDEFGGRYRFEAVGVSAVSYSAFDDSCGRFPDELPNPDVFTGGTIEGNICWSVRTEDAGTLVMYDDSAPDDERDFLSLIPRDDEDTATASAPNPETVGRIEVVNVEQALDVQGFEADVVRGTARSPQLSNPAQPISIGSDTLYVFVYSSVAERQADSNELDLGSLTLSAFGTPIAGDSGSPHVVTRGNVIVILPGGDDDVRERVDTAMASLPEVVGEPTLATPTA